MKRERTQGLRIKITKGAYRKIVDAAFRNCRTPEQEASFMVETQLSRRETATPIPERYDDPERTTGRTIPEPAPETAAPDSPPPMTTWTPEQESDIEARCKAAGMSDGEIAAHKLLHKTYDSAIKALEEVPA